MDSDIAEVLLHRLGTDGHGSLHLRFQVVDGRLALLEVRDEHKVEVLVARCLRDALIGAHCVHFANLHLLHGNGALLVHFFVRNRH